MSQQQVRQFKPFLSVLLVMVFLFSLAFIKMEIRRMSYSFVKLAQHEKSLRNKERERLVRLAKMTGPERVQLVATQKLPMKRASQGQIIQMTGDGIAYIQ